MITQEKLKHYLHYNPDTGIFIRINMQNKTKCTHKVVGTKNTQGYLVIRIENVLYFAHRLAWLYVYNEMPDYIDHFNKNRSDNRLSNLCNGTQSDNMKNSSLRVDNKTGFTGICFDKKRQQYRVTIKDKDKYVFLGRFYLIEDAIECREQANKVYQYKENHGLLC